MARALHVMAGLVPAIHVFSALHGGSWMPETSPGMTTSGERADFIGRILSPLRAGMQISSAKHPKRSALVADVGQPGYLRA